jgi:hypothetical protein
MENFKEMNNMVSVLMVWNLVPKWIVVTDGN